MSKTMISLSDLQKRLRIWQEHNFPGRPSWQPLLGAVEELGELAHVHLKSAQGIRTVEDHAAAKVDAVANVIVFLADYCNAEGIDLETALAETWAEVERRDWQADRARATRRRPEGETA